MDITFHYPPELLDLLIDTIPLLTKSKRGVLLFFRGAGVEPSLVEDLEHQLAAEPYDVNKYELARTVLIRLNQQGEKALKVRREVLKRVTEFDSFASCWPNDQLRAKGAVAEVRHLVNVKDSFTRMSQEREREADLRRREYEARLQELKRWKQELQSISFELGRLFSSSNPQSRGKKLEEILNRLFLAYKISVREAFALVGEDKEGVIEQVDGVIELDSELYLVEMKWWNKPLGTGEVAQHIVRVMNRRDVRGLIISTSGFTEPAVKMCKEALSQGTVVLCSLDELMRLVDTEGDLVDVLRRKVQSAVIDKNPYERA